MRTMVSSTTAKVDWYIRVRERLAEIGITHSAFARSIRMSQSRFSNYMQGAREPALLEFMLIVSALGVSADWVLFGGNRPTNAVHSSLASQIEALPSSARRDIEAYLRVRQAGGK